MPLGDLLEHLDPLAAEFGKFRRARHSDLDGLLARIALLLAKNEAPVFALRGSPLYEARSQKQLNVSMGLTPSRPSKSQGANKISIAVQILPTGVEEILLGGFRFEPQATFIEPGSE